MFKRTKLIGKGINEINLVLWISSLISTCLVLARVVYTGEWTYIFLVWNLFLAWIPYVMSYKLRKSHNLRNNDFMLCLWGCIWLLFYPNASYIVTDLFHLAENNSAPKWFDLILIMLFAWNGLILGIMSLYDMQTVIIRKKGKSVGTVFLFLVILLTGFGVYLGRYERWNSWDLFVNTQDLFMNIFHIAVHPIRNARAYGFTLVFAMFQGILYFMFLKAGTASAKRITD